MCVYVNTFSYYYLGLAEVRAGGERVQPTLRLIHRDQESAAVEVLFVID